MIAPFPPGLESPPPPVRTEADATREHDKLTRGVLVRALIDRRSVVVMSEHEGHQCAVLGRVIKVGMSHVVLENGRERSGIPIEAITSVETEAPIPAVTT